MVTYLVLFMFQPFRTSVSILSMDTRANREPMRTHAKLNVTGPSNVADMDIVRISLNITRTVGADNTE